MNRNDQDESDILDLGSATAETKGGAMGYEDMERTFWLHAGLTHD